MGILAARSWPTANSNAGCTWSAVVLTSLFICREVFGAIANGRLLDASVIDEPTKLYNARHFVETLDSEIEISVRTESRSRSRSSISTIWSSWTR